MRKSHEFYFSGLDNPTKILSGGKDESESVQAKPRSKVQKIILEVLSDLTQEKFCFSNHLAVLPHLLQEIMLSRD